jgi:hypothetical protein
MRITSYADRFWSVVMVFLWSRRARLPTHDKSVL